MRPEDSSPKSIPLAALAVAGLLAGPALAQDSVSITGCPTAGGDAVDPFADATATNGSEQSNRYVVDLTKLTSSWGTEFGIAPIIKHSKVNSDFVNNQGNAQTFSRLTNTNVPISGTYDLWNFQGGGVNNDPLINFPGNPIGDSDNGNAFAVGFQEFGTTVDSAGFTAVTTGLVKYDPSQASRLYVDRVIAAISGCDTTSSLSAVHLGSIDVDGNIVFRADNFGATGAGTCGLPVLSGNNIFMVDSASRDTDILNVISDNYPLGQFDVPVTKWIVQGAGSPHNAPGIADIGGTPYYIGSNFNKEYVSGAATGVSVATTAHLGPGMTDHRGNASWVSGNFAPLGSTNGVAAILAYDAAGDATTMNIWGLGAGAAITGVLPLTLPPVVTDNSTFFVNLGPGPNEFDHYHDQVAFRGGNSQIAMNYDGLDRLLVAGTVDHPTNTGNQHNDHYIAVARLTDVGGGGPPTVEWTMAAYQDGVGGGKPILDGPGGNQIGQCCRLVEITQGAPEGPSFSSPMIDSFGNVWVLSAVEIFDPLGGPSEFNIALLRAVYDPATFSYELELVFELGEIFAGQNSTKNYRISHMEIADDNSISSRTTWSQNISQQGHSGQRHRGLSGADPKHLGGMVISAEVTYDWEGDGDYDTCKGMSGDPTSLDENYNVLLYLGSVQDCQLDLGSQGPGNLHQTFCGTGLAPGDSSTIRVTGLPPFGSASVVVSNPGFPDLPIFGGTVVSGLGGILAGYPRTFGADANGEVIIPLNGNVAANFVMQWAAIDLSLPQFVAFSNALLVKFGQ
jgi:hypothetical protein